MKVLILGFVLLVGLTSRAGTWVCETGLDGTLIYHLKALGTEQGLTGPAEVSVVGQGAGRYSVVAEQAGAGELARYIIGGENPRSKTRFRILAAPLQPNVYRAFSLLENTPLKMEFNGTCTYTP